MQNKRAEKRGRILLIVVGILFSGFIRCLKKIFHIRPKQKYDKKRLPAKGLPKRKPVGLPQQPEEISIKIVPTEGKPGKDSLSEGKPIEVTLTEEKTIDVTQTTEVRIPKPYKKKSPTEEDKEELPTVKRKLPGYKQRKTIHLGNTQRRRRSLIGKQRKTTSDENIEKETADKVTEEKEFATIVESPFVEIDLVNAEVYLSLPRQQFKADTVDETPQQTSYSIDLNGQKQEVLVRITTDRDGLMFVEEKRILLKEPLVKFQITFPDEIQGGEYNYNHYDKGLYAFIAIGNNRGRMYYLFDKDGNGNPLPQRVIWVLLHEEFILQTILGPSDITDERWIWDRYKPFRIDLREISALVIRNRRSSKEKSFFLQSTFCVEGEQLIEDDFKKECPLFTGKILNLVAPYENQSGWNVWVIHKVVGGRMVSENWSGVNSLTLRLPDDLPCEFGEFQLDICQQNTRISDETLFFRFMSCFELNYPKELIIPNPRLGHPNSTISVKLDNDNEWELQHKEGLEFKLTQRNNIYEIELPPEEDILRFSIFKTTKPESICNFQVTLPRLKWKTSIQKGWSSKTQNIVRKDLKSGEPFYLRIQTNDFDNKYNLSALLETKGQKLQEGKFIQTGIEYSLELNQFYDTIKQNKDELSLRVEIYGDKQNYLNEICILKFKSSIIRCKYVTCTFETCRKEEIWSHFEKNHFHNLIEHLTYEELREYDKLLPHSIYKCAYCDFYSREDDLQNPTSSICAHIDNRCPKARRGEEPLRVSFSIISDINEIRQNVLPNLLEIYKCKLCSIHLKDYSQKAQVEHFFTKHGNEIYEYL